jgi:hypothetical protein
VKEEDIYYPDGVARGVRGALVAWGKVVDNDVDERALSGDLIEFCCQLGEGASAAGGGAWWTAQLEDADLLLVMLQVNISDLIEVIGDGNSKREPLVVSLKTHEKHENANVGQVLQLEDLIEPKVLNVQSRLVKLLVENEVSVGILAVQRVLLLVDVHVDAFLVGLVHDWHVTNQLVLRVG